MKKNSLKVSSNFVDYRLIALSSTGLERKNLGFYSVTQLRNINFGRYSCIRPANIFLFFETNYFDLVLFTKLLDQYK